MVVMVVYSSGGGLGGRNGGDHSCANGSIVVVS